MKIKTGDIISIRFGQSDIIKVKILEVFKLKKYVYVTWRRINSTFSIVDSTEYFKQRINEAEKNKSIEEINFDSINL